MTVILGTVEYSGLQSLQADGMPASDLAFAKSFTGAKYLNRTARLALAVSDRLPPPVRSAVLSDDDIGLCVATFGSHFEVGISQYLEIQNNDRPLISPILGPNNTPNSIASQLAIYHKTKAFALTFCDCGTAGMEAIAFAAMAIRRGKAKRVLVVGAEARPAKLESGLGGQDGAEPALGAVAFLLGGEEAAGERREPETVLARIEYVARGSFDPGKPDMCFERVSKCLRRAAGYMQRKNYALDAVISVGARNSPWREVGRAAINAIAAKDTDIIDVAAHPGSGVMRSIAFMYGVNAAMNWLRENAASAKRVLTVLICSVQPDGSIGSILVTAKRLK